MDRYSLRRLNIIRLSFDRAAVVTQIMATRWARNACMGLNTASFDRLSLDIRLNIDSRRQQTAGGTPRRLAFFGWDRCALEFMFWSTLKQSRCFPHRDDLSYLGDTGDIWMLVFVDRGVIQVACLQLAGEL